jgi:hypothetical protein
MPDIAASNNSVSDLDNDTTLPLNKISGGENGSRMKISTEAEASISLNDSSPSKIFAATTNPTVTSTELPIIVADTTIVSSIACSDNSTAVASDNSGEIVENGATFPMKKRRTYTKKSKPETPTEMGEVTTSAKNDAAVANSLQNINTPLTVQAVLNGATELSALDLDELEIYLTIKKQLLSAEDIEQLHRKVIKMENEVDACYFIHDMLTSFCSSLGEEETMTMEIRNFITILTEKLIKLEPTTTG